MTGYDTWRAISNHLAFAKNLHLKWNLKFSLNGKLVLCFKLFYLKEIPKSKRLIYLERG